MGRITDKKGFVYGLDSRHELIFAHIYDMAIRSDKYSCAVYGDFLSENSIALLTKREEMLPLSPVLFGGYEDAQRQMVAFIPEYEEPSFPLSVVKIISPRLKNLTHRDFLGSILGLGIKREKCGDIIQSDGCCYAILSDDIASYVANELKKVGREGVRCELSSPEEIPVTEKKLTPVSGTVSSLRLDAVVSLFAGKGRSKASEAISGGLVFVNGVCIQKSDMRVSDGDIISVRGKGKATLEVGGTSKKDRIFITLNFRS